MSFDRAFPVVASEDGTPLRIAEPFTTDGVGVMPASPVLVSIDFETESLFLVGLSFETLRAAAPELLDDPRPHLALTLAAPPALPVRREMSEVILSDRSVPATAPVLRLDEAAEPARFVEDPAAER